MEKIDIIIPCYNAHKKIDRCIKSVLEQNILEHIEITLINDGGKDYSSFINKYKELLPIKEIGYKENKGPASARNYGLLNTSHEFVMFMDADDKLDNPFSVSTLYNAFDKDTLIVIGAFTEEYLPNQTKTHTNDTTFLHGKMYRRTFLTENNILFKEGSRCNEDLGFNLLALLTADKSKVKYISYTTVYNWLYEPTSISRADSEKYLHSLVLRGFADNLTYVYENIKVDSSEILSEKAASMLRLYKLFHERTDGYPKYRKGNLEAISKFYRKIYKPIENKIDDFMFLWVYNSLQFMQPANDIKRDFKKFLKSL